jgi:hypothetical protein
VSFPRRAKKWLADKEAYDAQKAIEHADSFIGKGVD